MTANVNRVVGLTAALALTITACSGATTGETTSTTTTVAAITTTAPPICAARINRAVVIETPRSFDIDGDGIADTLWGREGSDQQRIQFERSSNGAFTEPIELPQRVAWPVEVLDAADLDTDGKDELLVDVGGNTALTAVILEVDGCATRIATSDGEPFRLLHSASGNSCAPTGCWVSVTCGIDGAARLLIETVASPGPDVGLTDEDFADWTEAPWAQVPMRQTTRSYRLLDGEVTLAAEVVIDAPAGDLKLFIGVHCAATIDGGEGCLAAPPPLTSTSEWTLGSLTPARILVAGFDTDVRTWTWIRAGDGAVATLENPSVHEGTEPVAYSMVDSHTAGLAVFADRIDLGWSTSVDAMVVDCERWTLRSRDLDRFELMALANSVIAADPADWLDDPLGP